MTTRERRSTKYKKIGNVESAVTATYGLSDKEVGEVEGNLGKGIFVEQQVSVTKKYDNNLTISMPGVEMNVCLNYFCEQHGAQLEKLELGDTPTKETIQERLKQLKEKQSTTEAEAETNDDNLSSSIIALEAIQNLFTELDWTNWLQAHIWKEYIKVWLPKFMYFDEYYELPSQVDLNHLAESESRG